MPFSSLGWFEILVLQEFSQGINFHFTQTTEHQPTGNVHSFTKLHVFAVMPAARPFDACFLHMQENTKICDNQTSLYISKLDYQAFEQIVSIAFKFQIRGVF